MRNRIIRVVIALSMLALMGVLYLSAQRTNAPEQEHNSALRNTKDFAWFKQWDELDLAEVKRYYQRYTIAEMRILWGEKLHAKYGDYEGREYADTVYPWDTYLARLLEFGYPFVDFSDYANALDTRMGILIPTRIYWQAMDTSYAKSEYFTARGLPPGVTWEMYEESLIKQIVVCRINWWRSGGMDPFSNRDSR